MRAQLGELGGGEWQKARHVMRQITNLTGHKLGPMGANIDPRACKYCNFFGHTKRYCKVRAKDEKWLAERKQTKEWIALELEREQRHKREFEASQIPYQAMYYDESKLPYFMHPLGIGPIPTFDESVAHVGKWTVVNGIVVERTVKMTED